MVNFSRLSVPGASDSKTIETVKSQPQLVQFKDKRKEHAVQLKLSRLANSGKESNPVQLAEIGEDEELQMKAPKESLQLKNIGGEEEVQLVEKEAFQLKRIGEEELQMKAVQADQRNPDMINPLVPLQRKENRTGLPDQLKSGVENLSGHSLDDVKVHYNSGKPAQLNAHAYAQGADIHIAPGQEKHLPHEAWHVVQQKQGRVKPTRQMKGKVNINDDAGLEKEADVMGGMALQAESKSPNGLKQQASGQLVQLVKNDSLRPQTDKRMNDLKTETIGILTLLKELGEDWEKKYGKLAKEKASAKTKGLLDGGESDYPAEIRKAALRELWSQLSSEEKLEMATEAARLGGNALSAVVSNGWTTLRELSGIAESTSGSKKKAKSREKEKQKETEDRQPEEKEQGSGSIGFLSELTAEDLSTLYDVYKLRKDALEKIAEAKSKIVDSAGAIGEHFGEAAGRIRNEVDFDKRMKAQEQAFKVARKRLEMLHEAIRENEDTDRYAKELDALDHALESLNGPGIVYRISLNDNGRSKHPDLCQDAIGYIRASSPLVTRDKTGVEWIGSLGRKLGSAFESGSSKEQKIATAQSQLAAVLENAVDRSWGKFTSWGWTPTAIKKIRKELPRDRDPKDKLDWAKKVAGEATGKESDNRHPETQIFYEAMASLDTTNETSLLTTASILSQLSVKLD